MNRTYMKKGIGAAPFAIVAALIIALAGGLWATQPAQAVDKDDVRLEVQDIEPTGVQTFTDPGGTDEIAWGGGGVAELRNGITEGRGTAGQLEKAFAGASANNVFRGSIERRATWVEFRAGVDDGTGTDGAAGGLSSTTGLSVTIEVSGEASLSRSTTFTSTVCEPQIGVCQFAVYSNGTPGGFSVTISGVEASLGGVAGGSVTKSGQWVGQPVAATVLTAPPATSEVRIGDDADTAVDEAGTAADRAAFGAISSGNFNTVTPPGLNTGQAGFLFQITDSAGQVAMTAGADDRDAVAVTVETDLGDPFEIDNLLSVPASADEDDLVFVSIGQETSFTGAQYPARANNPDPDPGTTVTGATGGLVAVGLVERDEGDSGMGRICVDVDVDGACEAEISFAVAGPVSGAMSSVGAISRGPANLAQGNAHVRIVTLRDKNGVPVNTATPGIVVKDTSEASGDHLGFAFAKTAADAQDLAKARAEDEAEDSATPSSAPLPGGVPAGKDGAYQLGITALTKTVDEHSFSVTVGTGSAKATITEDADGNPLVAHIASNVRGLAITSVTNLAGDELLSVDGGTQSVAAGSSRLLTITLSAIGSDALAPANDEVINAVSTSGGDFVGASSDGDVPDKTDDAGDATVRYVFGGNVMSTTLVFTSGSGEAVLIVAGGDEAAAVGPTIYSLVSGMGSTFVSWQGGDASSAEFENVANLTIVWKWTGNAWFRYVSDPSVPASLKTDFALSNGDVLFVVSEGPVDITLG